MSLLIVNADDWGYDRQNTDVAHECFLAGAISSVTAMVHMADSARAAEIAAGGGEPIGLHLNLTEPFTDPACPGVVRDRQARIARYFAGPKWRYWGFSPTLFTEIEACIGEQLDAFRELYGREPTHVDGHQHVHQSLGVMFARTLPSGIAMRPSYTFGPGEKSPPNRAVRAVFNRLMRTRFRTPRWFFDIRQLHPALGGRDLERKLDLANRDAVEVMTHPAWADERTLLLGEDWAAALRGRPLGTYCDLSA